MHLHSGYRFALGCILALTIGSSPAVAAQPAADDGKALAKQKVVEGQELYEQARYEEALVAFQDAAAAYASPDFQFNIGLCHERLGEPQAAIRAFEAYLRNKPEATDRASVEHRIAELRAQLERDQSPPPPVIDSTPQPVERTAAPSPSEPTHPPSARPLVVSGATMLGVGGALALAGGVGFGIPAGRRAERIDNVLVLDNPEGLTRAQTESLAAEGDRLRTLQITSLAVGGTLAITGAVLLATGLQRRRRAQLSLSPRGFALAARF